MKNKPVLKHIIFWILYFGIEILAYKNDWSQRFWAIALVNNSLTLISFYLCYYFGLQLYKKTYYFSESGTVTQHAEFWKILGVLTLFIILRVFSDIEIFNPNSNVSIVAYSFIIFRIALSIILPGILLGIGLSKEQIIRLLNRKQKELQSIVEAYEMKAIQLNSIIETKEQVIQQLDEQVNNLIYSREGLITENEQLKDDNELLRLTKTGLEEDIAVHQNHILILKTELLAGQEDYRQLVLRYEAKFDFYGRQLNKYRNLYGRLDGEDEKEPE